MVQAPVHYPAEIPAFPVGAPAFPVSVPRPPETVYTVDMVWPLPPLLPRASGINVSLSDHTTMRFHAANFLLTAFFGSRRTQCDTDAHQCSGKQWPDSA